MTNSDNKAFKRFKDDADFILKHTDGFILENGNKKMVVVPAYQGRIMTSTATGDNGVSLGWINRDWIASGKFGDNFSPLGGEDRFWIGPEGGRFGLFYDPGKPLTWENWCTPGCIDREPFRLIRKTSQTAVFEHSFKAMNYSKSDFHIKVKRIVNLLSAAYAEQLLNTTIPAHVDFVGFQSDNCITNAGNEKWSKEKGLINIWNVGIFVPSPKSTIIIPLHKDKFDPKLISDDYYIREIPGERLIVKKHAVFFKGDGQYQCKIGVNARLSKGIIGSYDSEINTLTIVIYNKPQELSQWANHKNGLENDPFDGDDIMSYNDGPANPGEEPFGPYYELETNSPVKELDPGDILQHINNTFHFQGNEYELNTLSKTILGVEIQELKTVIPLSDLK